MNIDDARYLQALIRTIPDFPSPGIQFRDVMPLLADAHGFSLALEALAEGVAPHSIDLVAAIEARGFLLGGAVAQRLGCGLLPVRKPGKLPGPNHGIDYALEYGSDRLEMQVGAVKPGARVLVIDDLIATGGTALACGELIGQAGGKVAAFRFLIDLPDLGGTARLAAQGWDARALLRY
ncbi:adenine phosphoribosyltransferase [Methyloversatilis sp. XJ19-49]|uniref:adenine phosphoribosyltransferase n=1 Tax=Methyloversatilis sp. XJ19-49 TaxID=2963429 RepID=UPI00211D0D6A|nr:adenine phosphoribosyltransferase [Methyloversatilis sp. XJ19-49]MCQ9378961.1 adenine phosphoribosyltransferase [Methyloversatilis sp. XJ19-49]